MKRILAFALAATLLTAGLAHAGNVGLGAFGGMSIPVLQEDQDQGSVYGLRIPLNFTPLLTVEPFWSTSGLGDKTVNVGGVDFTREGSDVTTYGANVLLSTSGPMRFYPYAGIGSVKFERSGQDDSYTSYHFGLGLGFTPAPKMSLDIRAELQAAVKDDISRKMANITVGASYALFSLN
jgi:opacity protein-like surface antigen